MLSAKLSEESIQILSKGLLFEEAFYKDKVDVNIDSNEKLTPTIGIVDKLAGLSTSGRLVVMTDSSCMDSASPTITKCFWLIDRFVRIATEEIEKDQALMSDKYLLPKDYKNNERPRY